MTKPSLRLMIAFLAASSAAICNSAYAQRSEPTELVDQQHCMFCHTSDAPFLAPAFHQIAERYRNDPDAMRMLEQKLRSGGRAHWGDMPMPVSAERGGPPLSDEDARTLIQWVMSQ
jgi:cytochrome c